MNRTARTWGAFIAGAVAGGILTAAVVATAEPGLADRIRTGDFAYIWSGPRALLEGDDPYDPARWAARTGDLTFVQNAPAIYSYPPTVAVALIPLALLPEPLAWLCWTVGGVLLASWAVGRLATDLAPGRPGLALVSGFLLTGTRGAWVTILSGQATFFLVAALALTLLAIRADRPRRAAVGALALTLKPQLVALALPAFAWIAYRRGHAAAIAWFAGLGGLLVLVSLALVPRGWAAWLATVPNARTAEIGSPTLLNAARDVGLPVPIPAIAAITVAVAIIAVATRFTARGDAALAVWTAGSLAVAPYTNTYDQLLLVVPALVAAAVADRRSAAGGRRTILGSALLLAVGGIALVAIAEARGGIVTFAAFLPLALFALVAAACWADRRAAPG